MKIGIMQPYFFPYLGHFALIAAVDEWVVFDVTQYTAKSWISRNRVLHPKQGWNYIAVPLKKSSSSIKISEVLVQDKMCCERSLLGKLSHYKKHAPYYTEVIEVVKSIFIDWNGNNLVDLNISILTKICNYLGGAFNYQKCSDLDIEYPEVMNAGDWAPIIANHLKAKDYINPSSGIGLFERHIFNDNNVRLWSLGFSGFEYETSPFSFEENLSVLDAMMWNDPKIIYQALIQASTVKEVF